MSAASDLFETIRNFRNQPVAGRSPHGSLVEYCQRVLGGVERVHFDFKSKANPATPGLDESDKKNLARAISGFANGAGGVLIWGIEDESIAPSPINNVSKFVDEVLQLSHNVTAPAVPGIDGDFIPADGDPNSGYGLFFVPESDLPPHRVVLTLARIQNHYFIRSGTSFLIASHSQLEDMFGRRPRPLLTVEFELEARSSDQVTWITVVLTNQGRGIARCPFLSLDIDRPYGLSEWGVDGNGRFGLPVIEKGNGFNIDHRTLYGSMSFGSQEGFVIHSGMRHPITKIVRFSTQNSGSETRDLSLRWRIAAEGLPLREDEQVITESELVRRAQK